MQQVFSGSTSSWSTQLSAIASGGVQLARIDARWADVEPDAPSGGVHSYDWSQYDAIVQAMAQHGVRWYPIVAYSTSWSGLIAGDTESAVAPAHVGDFAAYAAALARRYGRGGSFWAAHPSLPRLPVESYEIWNEENSSTFLHPQDAAPERYADLYMAARGAIKSVDPAATVVVGGLALGKAGVTDEEQFLQRMYAQRPDLRGNVDGVGLHPYQQNVADTYMRLAGFRAALDRVAGPSVPIEITEIGWATTSVSEAQRAADLTQLAEQLPRSDCNVDRLMPYTWLTAESNPADPEDWFGIWNHDGSPKPSGAAYLNAVRLMHGAAAPSGTVAICHPAAVAAAVRQRPLFTLRVVRVKRRHWVKVSVHCRPSCLMRVELLARRRTIAREAKPVAKRDVLVRAGQRRVLRLRIRHAYRLRRRAHVRGTALAKGGDVTVRSRRVRIR